MTLEILTNAQMRGADEAAIGGGIPAYGLMLNAATAVFEEIVSRFSPRPVTVLCGPGNNGGDGYAVAQKLMAAEWDVQVLASQMPFSEEARRASNDYKGKRRSKFEPVPLVIDALYGTGLARGVEGAEAELIRRVNDSGAFVVAIDMPSGVNGDNGQAAGAAIRAGLTVALCRKKLGHVLMPGRQYCGEVVVRDIGIHAAYIDKLNCAVRENAPELWRAALPFPQTGQHKYARGHAIVSGGDMAHGGAARLAARAALRIGAGLVSIQCSQAALPAYAASLTAVMCKVTNSIEQYAALLSDQRVTAVVIGPGTGVTDDTKDKVLAALQARKKLVLDADALTAFADSPQELFGHIRSPCVLTPHEGELSRLYAHTGIDLARDKLACTLQAAAMANAIVLLKGTDTVIAAPEGYAIINTNAPPTLATAGSGDVLAGMIAGLIAAGMPSFQAGAAAAWMHGEAARLFGDGLIAEDLPEMLPKVLSQLRAMR